MAYTVYGFTGSTYTRTVRMILAEKSVPYELVSVNIITGEGGSPEHLRRHPFGKVPALQDGDLMLYETAAIAEYLEGKHPQPALVPADVTARARMRQWQSVVDSYVYPNFIGKLVWQRLVNPMLEQPVDEQVVEQCLPDVHKIGRLIDAALDRSEYLAGPELSLADLYLAPPTAYLSMTEEGKALLEEQSRYNRWWEAMQARRSFQETPFQ